MFEKQNFENIEQIKDYTSKIELIFYAPRGKRKR